MSRPFARYTAEASRRGRDYQGRGVHVAARIGAAAISEEILVSSAALGAMDSVRFGLSEPRQLVTPVLAEFFGAPVPARR